MDNNTWTLHHGAAEPMSYVKVSGVSEISDVSDDDDEENGAKEERLFSSSEPCSYEHQVQKDRLFSKASELKRRLAKDPWEGDVSDDENPANKKRKITLCCKCNECPATESINIFTSASAENIVLCIKSLLDEVSVSAVTKQLSCFEDDFKVLGKMDWTELASIIEEKYGESETASEPTYNVIDLDIQPYEVQLKCKRERLVKCITHNKTGRMIDLVPITEECSNILLEEGSATNNEFAFQESINEQNISYFFPKLLAKIALESKSDSSIENSLQSKHSIFILCCKAKLALKFNNIDASALFKLTAIEVERSCLNQAFIYYKHAVLSLSCMIFEDNIFPFLSESELTENSELFQNYERFFLYSEIKTAIMNDDCIISFIFEADNCTEISETEIDETEAKESINCFSMRDLEKYATMYKNL